MLRKTFLTEADGLCNDGDKMGDVGRSCCVLLLGGLGDRGVPAGDCFSGESDLARSAT